MITRGLTLPTVRPAMESVTHVIAIWYRALYIIYVNGDASVCYLFQVSLNLMH